MVLSKRERFVLIAALLAMGALATDRIALAPLRRQSDELDKKRAGLVADLNRSRSLMDGRAKAAPAWRDMTQQGLKSDPAEAESQVLRAIRDWSEESGIALSLLRPERLTEKSRMPRIAFQAAGTGSLRAVSWLLWRIETAKIPLKLTEVQLAARKEGVDDLTVQLRLSTIYAPATAPPASQPGDASGGR